MKQVFIRPTRPQDSKEFLDWSLATKDNEFDPNVASQPGTFTLCAYNKEKKIAFLPVQQTFTLESLALNPEATNLEIAQALMEFFRFLVAQGHIKGINEMIFVASNELTIGFAKRHAFEELPYKLYRVKISDLEPSQK